MLKYDKLNRTLTKVKETSLTNEQLLERPDLQASIINSWDVFRNEINFPSAMLIGQEINPDQSTLDRLDILALDSEDLSLIVLELKREKNKLHLLQAISYAAMLSNTNNDELKEIAQSQKCYEHEELIEFLESNDLSSEIKIILIAESFHPEVIITADWLKNYGISVYAFAINTHHTDNEVHLGFEQRYPLRELTEVYDHRKNVKKSKIKELSWDDVISKCEYDFAKKAINMCKKIKEGEPSRKRFVHILKDFQGFNWMSFLFRRKYINIYLVGGDQEIFNRLVKKLPTTIQTGSWKRGFWFHIKEEKEFEQLIKLDNRFDY